MSTSAAPSNAAAPAPVASSQRPVPLVGRRDLQATAVDFRGDSWWVVKDPVNLQYHRMQAEHYCVLQLLDGVRSLKQIRDELAKQFPAAPLQLADIQRTITNLHAQGLVWNQRPGHAGNLLRAGRSVRRQKLWQLAGNLLSIRLPGWDPDQTLTQLHRSLKWIFHPVTGFLALLLVISAWTLLVVEFDEFLRRLPEFRRFFGWQNLAWLWLTLAATKVLHEFGHGLTCKHFGSECHEMGVMLLVFSPTMYCDVTDSWMLADKWKRIWIAAAGMIVEVVVSALAIFVWWFTTPGLLNHLCLNVFFVTTITTVIFNANPLLRYDGYYMLSDWLEIPNLRMRSANQLRSTFAGACLGIPSAPDPLLPETGRLGFLAYAVASTLYGWFVLFGVLGFLYVVLKPYGLQSLGMALAAFSLLGIAGRIATDVWRILSAPRSEPMNHARATSTVFATVGLIACAMMVPLPWYVEAPFLIEPHNVTHVLSPAAGRMVSMTGLPGNSVEKGQTLVRLVDDRKDDQLRKLLTARDAQVAEIEKMHALEQTAQHALARQRLRSFETQIAELQQQMESLTIVAPISGRVVAAPKVPATPLSRRRRLAEWSGHISDPRNIGCQLAVRTHLMSIAPDHRMQALLYLDQAHRDDLVVGQPIEIKFEHLADQTYRGTVAEIAQEQSEEAPVALSTKQGGGLNSVTDWEGHERLTSVAYQARVVLDRETRLLKPGMRGTARFLVDRRSAAGWLWRAFRRTMHFRM